ncbi:hypothetical protein D3C73_1017700 [compost metagenome]
MGVARAVTLAAAFAQLGEGRQGEGQTPPARRLRRLSFRLETFAFGLGLFLGAGRAAQLPGADEIEPQTAD